MPDSDVSFGFVVSSSRAALLLPVTLHELRLEPVGVYDSPPRMIMAYLEKGLLEIFPRSSREEGDDWITNYTQQIGTRFLDSVNLLRTLEHAKIHKKKT